MRAQSVGRRLGTSSRRDLRIRDIARERGLSVDLEGFEAAMDVQRARARAASQFGGGVQVPADSVQTDAARALHATLP